MTAIKTVSVTSPTHAKNLARYLNDQRALMRRSQNIMNPNNWEKEFERTRKAYGHDVPAKTGAKNTIEYHQVIAFNPDECSPNGGKMTPEECMKFAQEWVQTRYPYQEAVMVLHKEHCSTDNTDRYAVHIGINRTNLATGNRLNEGRSRNAKVARAKAMRTMDERWGLRQMRAGVRNSRTHARQPSRAEIEMRNRGIKPRKDFIRERVEYHTRSINAENFRGNRMRELSRRLKDDGIKMSISKRGNQPKFQQGGLVVNGNKLGRGYSIDGLAKGLGMERGLHLNKGLTRGIN